MEQIKCKECELEFKTLDSLRRHRSQKHDINAEQTYLDYVLNGKQPTCKCGCGDKPKYLGIKKGYRDYIRGHSQRINNNWGHNQDALKKSHDTQKKMHESGELVIWNKGLTTDDPRVRDNIDKVMSNPERGKNISKALSGVSKSEEHKEKLSNTAKERWSDPKEREKQSHRRMLWMKENNHTVKSTLEEKINLILLSFGLIENIDYERQYYVRDIKSYYDFKILKTDVLIEIDGDFWHCNPKSKFKEPIYECQFKNINKDKIKNEWCNNNNIKLFRFWEDDINNNPEDVINKLKLYI